MVAISLDDLRRSSSLVIVLSRVDDYLVPESTTVKGNNHERSVRAIAGGAELQCDPHRCHRWPAAASGTDVWHLRGADSTPAWLGFSINISGHLLGRAVITPWAEIPAA